MPIIRHMTREEHDDFHNEIDLSKSKDKDKKVLSILIPLEEYKELLIIKGMYQEQNRVKINAQIQPIK